MFAPSHRAGRRGRPALTVADILREHVDELDELTSNQRKVVSAMLRCRTAELGGHLNECSHCGKREISYNSCRNRHCPLCQGGAGLSWAQEQMQKLLPVEYFHLVFTIPSEFHSIFRSNPKTCYNLLFQAASETIREIALDPKHLGAKIGFTAVQHTWTQTMLYHPHIHCIIPGGGLSKDGESWIGCRAGFFLPVRVLSAVFRGKLIAKIRNAAQSGEVRSPRNESIPDVLRLAAAKDWVVYAKAPMAGPEKVIEYISRYTHRISISNWRILSFKDGRVTFQYKDRADGDRKKTMTLDATDFLKRFLQHVLPSGFVRIRHYGLLANAAGKKLKQCRELLDYEPPKENLLADAVEGFALDSNGGCSAMCPWCKVGRMIRVEEIPRARNFASGP